MNISENDTQHPVPQATHEATQAATRAAADGTTRETAQGATRKTSDEATRMATDIAIRTSPGWLARWLHKITGSAALVLIAALLLTAASLYYAATHLGVNNSTVDMLDARLPFRVEYDRLRTEFPLTEDSMLLVVEAPTPEQALSAASELETALKANPEAVEQVFWPAGNPFLRAHGLLLRPLDDLEQMTDTLSRAQPLLSRLAADTRASVFLELLTEAETYRDTVAFDTDFLKAALTKSLAGSEVDARPPTPLSWQRLLGGNTGADPVAREMLVVKPRLVEGKVNAAKPAMQALDAQRRALGLDEGPVTLRITGAAALKFEELESVVSGARLTGLAALFAVTLIMVRGLRSWRFILVALVSLMVGLALTSAFAAAAIGRVNLISVAFVVLYVGLGVNYAVHYLLRARELNNAGAGAEVAIEQAGTHLGGALMLSALTTALGFFAFTPTAFSGVAELGLIAGFAMFVTLCVTYTVTPALLHLVGMPAVEPARAALAAPDAHVGWLEFPIRYRRGVLWLALCVTAGGLWFAPQVTFDSDPLALRDPKSESVQTMQALLESRTGGYRNIQVLVDGDTPLAPIIQTLEALPEVDHVNSIDDLVVRDADAKLAAIDELNFLLGPDILDADWQPQADTPGALAAAAGALRDTLDPSKEVDAALAQALAALAQTLTGPDAQARVAAIEAVLLGQLKTTMTRLAEALSVTDTFTIEDLPPDVLALTRNAEGTRLLQVVPAGAVEDFRAQNRFAEAVSAVVPTATGAPIIQLAAGQAIAQAFVAAVGWALAGITLVLLIVLRSLGDTLKVLTPLLMGGILTLAFMVWTDMDFNFANVVALPLLLGVGVDNGIHLVLRWRQGALPGGAVLATATARAIVLGAMITAGGFGNLALSPHQGTASMGIILAVGLALVVSATLVVLPALLGRAAYPLPPASPTPRT